MWGNWWWTVLAVARLARGDWSECPPCHCTWFSGMKGADCADKKLTDVPDPISTEIQTIDMSNNELHSLPKEAFRAAGLVNLHRIRMRHCQIEDIHKDAFEGLQILIDLDLSDNRIHTVHPDTFRHNVRLRVITMHHNPMVTLDDGLFANLVHLQTVDLHDCQLARISPKAFFNASSLHTLILNRNNLSHMKVEAIQPLDQLVDLEIQENPWRCDCHLRHFRDWALGRNLVANRSTACAQPPHLASNLWKDMSSEEFACKPQIVYPPLGKRVTVVAAGVEATLSCKVMGDPEPEVFWVIDSRIVTRSSLRGDPRYTIHKGGGWVNLTVGRVSARDRGELICVAQSPGGIDERIVTLVVPNESPIVPAFRSAIENLTLILGLVTGLLALLVVLCCCHHRCRCQSAPLADADITYPVQRNGQRPTELAEMNHNLLEDTVSSVGQENEESSTESVATTPSLLEAPNYTPDLLAIPQGRCTPPHLTSTVHVTQSYSRFQSPFSPSWPGYVTVPLRPHVSSWSCDPTPTPLEEDPFRSPFSPALSGYVTIPRRPRVSSWANVPTPTLFEDPYWSQTPFSSTLPGYVTIPRRPRAPSWSPPPTLLEDPLALLKMEHTNDDLSSCTSADASVLSSNTSLGEAQMRPRLLPQHCRTLPTPRRSRVAPEGTRLHCTTSAEGLLSTSKPKVPPKPHPKPKKYGPLYRAKGEDGTLV